MLLNSLLLLRRTLLVDIASRVFIFSGVVAWIELFLGWVDP